MKRGIDDSNDCDTMNTIVQIPGSSVQNQMHYTQHQLNINSSSPLSNSSSNSSSSCLTTASFSPLQHHQPILYAASSTNGSAQSLPSLNPNSQIILSLPMVTTSTTPNTTQVTTHPTNQGLNSTGVANSSSSASTNSTASLESNSSPNNTQSIYSYSSSSSSSSSSTTQKPEAKKVKTQKTQPSKVVHIRNIPQQITEIEIIQFGLIFGNIANVLNLRSKCQAFLEFEKCEEAQSMINYFSNNPISVAGRQIFVQYSNYKNLVTDPTNTNNQVAKAALDLAKDLHKAAQTGGQNTVLRAMIQNMLYCVSLDTIYQIFNRFGPVLKIITFTKNDKFQALIQMKDANAAQAAKTALHGQNIYNSCCTLHIDYSKLNTLNVKYNNEKSRDYTNPLLPAGDCPDHLAIGPGGVINSSIQLTMAAAAAAAAVSGYATPFTTAQIGSGYHLAPAGNPFLPINGKYIPQQAILNASTLLQTTLPNGASAGSQTQNPTVIANPSAQIGNAVISYSGQPSTNTQLASNQPTSNVNTIIANPHPGHPQSGHMIIPFLQNLNEESRFLHLIIDK